jgi:hypothetical protein
MGRSFSVRWRERLKSAYAQSSSEWQSRVMRGVHHRMHEFSSSAVPGHLINLMLCSFFLQARVPVPLFWRLFSHWQCVWLRWSRPQCISSPVLIYFTSFCASQRGILWGVAFCFVQNPFQLVSTTRRATAPWVLFCWFSITRQEAFLPSVLLASCFGTCVRSRRRF